MFMSGLMAVWVASSLALFCSTAHAFASLPFVRVAYRARQVLTTPTQARIDRSLFRSTRSDIRVEMVMEDFSIFDEGSRHEGNDDVEHEELSDQELLERAGDWDDRIARFNTVHLTGRIGNDPEPRYFDDGKVVVNLSLANRRKYHAVERMVENIKSWRDEEVDWYRLEIWGQTAEFVTKFVEKGTRVGVVGSLVLNEWTNRESGELRRQAKIYVREIDILETKGEAELRRSRKQGGNGNRSSFGSEDDGGYTPAGTGGFFG